MFAVHDARHFIQKEGLVKAKLDYAETGRQRFESKIAVSRRSTQNRLLNMHARIGTHTHTYARARTHTHTHARTHKHTHTHTHVRARAHTHTHTYAHTWGQTYRPHKHAETHSLMHTSIRFAKHTFSFWKPCQESLQFTVRAKIHLGAGGGGGGGAPTNLAYFQNGRVPPPPHPKPGDECSY